MAAGFISGGPTGTSVNQNFAGDGTLASSGNGLVTISEVPAVAKIFVLERNFLNVVAITASRPDGTWEVNNLKTSLRFSIIARAADGEEVISGNVAPVDPNANDESTDPDPGDPII